MSKNRFGHGQTPTGNPFRRIGIRPSKGDKKVGDVAVPARAHQEENEGNDTSWPRVDVERLCHLQELPRKPPTGCP